MKKFLIGILVSVIAYAETEAPTYTVEVNQSTSSRSIKELTGLKVPKNWKQLGRFEEAPVRTAALPSRYDWREHVSVAPSIVNQGYCGSCWAFGTTAILRWNLAINKGVDIDLSEQEILSCSRKGTCNGGYFAHAYQETPGQSEEGEFKYQGRDLRCKSGLSHKYRIKDWGYVGSSRRSPTVAELKQAILDHGPVAVTVTANRSMQNYRSGIFNGCTKGYTNHIVHLVGWDDAQGVWIMGNSWGKNWGENGYMRIRYNCSRIGEIATYIEN